MLTSGMPLRPNIKIVWIVGPLIIILMAMAKETKELSSSRTGLDHYGVAME